MSNAKNDSETTLNDIKIFWKWFLSTWIIWTLVIWSVAGWFLSETGQAEPIFMESKWFLWLLASYIFSCLSGTAFTGCWAWLFFRLTKRYKEKIDALILENKNERTSRDQEKFSNQIETVPGKSHNFEGAKDKKLKVLLAEDFVLNQKMICILLNRRGYDVELAKNGIEAISMFQQEAFDLILMDLCMSEMDGCEATRMIRKIEAEKGGHIPIIAVTACNLPEDRNRCLDAGMDDYITKPIQEAKLIKAIKTLSVKFQNNNKTSCNNNDEQKTGTEVTAIDIKALFVIVDESWELVCELIELYLKNLAPILSKIELSIAEADAPSLVFAAHSLKGMSCNIAAMKMSDLALDIEKKGRTNDISGAEKKYEDIVCESEVLKADALKILKMPASILS
ncbi:response regulator [Desulfobacterales bacterium HSG16]|nr:response regulator [Desulfobacterales bacterium HSG16]